MIVEQRSMFRSLAIHHELHLLSNEAKTGGRCSMRYVRMCAEEPSPSSSFSLGPGSRRELRKRRSSCMDSRRTFFRKIGLRGGRALLEVSHGPAPWREYTSDAIKCSSTIADNRWQSLLMGPVPFSRGQDSSAGVNTCSAPREFPLRSRVTLYSRHRLLSQLVRGFIRRRLSLTACGDFEPRRPGQKESRASSKKCSAGEESRHPREKPSECPRPAARPPTGPS